MQCPRCHAGNCHSRRFCGEGGWSFAFPRPACGCLKERTEECCGGCGAAVASSHPDPENRFVRRSRTPQAARREDPDLHERSRG